MVEKPDETVVKPATSYSVPRDLGVISTYFNSQGYQTKASALQRYLDAMRTSGIPFLLVEGAFGKKPFSLPRSTDVLHVRCIDVMWQKERLLNLALPHLPASCRKVAWLDADVLFSNPNWAVATSELLDEYPIVQPFEMALWLPQGDNYFRGRGLAWPSFGKVMIDRPQEFRSGNFDRHGHCGYAWAARREILERHGLFDRSIAGGGDHLMAHAMGGDFSSLCVQKMVGRNTRYSKDFARWGRPFYRDVRSCVGAAPGHLLHLWHGDKVKRRYSERSSELLDIQFDPKQDLRISRSGAWEWASERPELHSWATNYFARREEDAKAEMSYHLPRAVISDIMACRQPTKLPGATSGTPAVRRPTRMSVVRKMARSEDWY